MGEEEGAEGESKGRTVQAALAGASLQHPSTLGREEEGTCP